MEESNNGQSYTQMSFEEFKKEVADYLNTKYPNIKKKIEILMRMLDYEDYCTWHLQGNCQPSVLAEAMLSGLW